MLGRVVFSDTGSFTVSRERLAELTFLKVCLPGPKLRRRHIRRAVRVLRGNGVRRVLAPPEFPCWQQLAQGGILPVDTVPFLQGMSVPLAMAALERSGIMPERATVMLAGQTASKAFCDAAVDLCPLVQHLVIAAPTGGAALANYLRREFGLPLMEYCRAPHLILLFSEMPAEPEMPAETEVPVLRLHSPACGILGFDLRPKDMDLPPDCEALPFMAVLWETGRFTAKDIAVFPCEET